MTEPIESIAVAPNEPIARMWADALAEEGIRSLVRPLGPGFGAWGSVATFEHDIAVLSQDADRARDLISALAEDDEDYEE
jgi:hypothetical protein